MSTDDPALLIDLFCRKSRARASKGKREISISAQEKRGRLVAEQLGLTVRHVWREVGSASRFSTRKKRSDQDEALAALERGEIGALWAFRLDRWDRRGAGSILKILEPEDGLPRRLIFDNGDPEHPGIGLDSANPRDRRQLIDRAEDAREETEILSERVRNTKAYQRASGQWVNPTPPYGLKVVMVEVEDEDGDVVIERKLTRDDSSAAAGKTKADVARLIFTTPVSEGISGRAVVRMLNEQGIPSPSGSQWAFSTVRDMIHNPAYAGWQTTGRQDGRARRILYRDSAGQRVSVMQGPPLVTDAEQTAAQRALRGEEGIGVPKDRPHDTRPAHRLTGLLVCGGCGSPMSFSGTSYACWKLRSGKPHEMCASVARKSIEEWVHYRWSARLTNSEISDPIVAAVADRWGARIHPEAAADSVSSMQALSAAEADLARVWADRKAGLYEGPSEQFFAPALAEANEAVVKARAAMQSSLARRQVDVTFLLDPESCGDTWEAADEMLKRDLLRLAIDKVVVTKAPYRGCPFDGWKRTTFHWVDSEVD
jgi:site-specific DNA recombinase